MHGCDYLFFSQITDFKEMRKVSEISKKSLLIKITTKTNRNDKIDNKSNDSNNSNSNDLKRNGTTCRVLDNNKKIIRKGQSFYTHSLHSHARTNATSIQHPLQQNDVSNHSGTVSHHQSNNRWQDLLSTTVDCFLIMNVNRHTRI